MKRNSVIVVGVFRCLEDLGSGNASSIRTIKKPLQGSNADTGRYVVYFGCGQCFWGRIHAVALLAAWSLDPILLRDTAERTRERSVAGEKMKTHTGDGVGLWSVHR